MDKTKIKFNLIFWEIWTLILQHVIKYYFLYPSFLPLVVHLYGAVPKCQVEQHSLQHVLDLGVRQGGVRCRQSRTVFTIICFSLNYGGVAMVKWLCKSLLSQNFWIFWFIPMLLPPSEYALQFSLIWSLLRIQIQISVKLNALRFLKS